MLPMSYKMLEKTFAITPGVYVIEEADIQRNHKCDEYLEKEIRFCRGPIEPDKIPEQALRNKLAHIFDLLITGSYFDKVAQTYVFKRLINDELIEEYLISKAEVCETMHWLDFDFCDNGININFTLDKAWFEPLSTKHKKHSSEKA